MNEGIGDMREKVAALKIVGYRNQNNDEYDFWRLMLIFSIRVRVQNCRKPTLK
jgi:hypothetical protein